MGMVMLLLPTHVADLSLGPDAASRLIELGVTYAALLSDDRGAALLLDGREFRPDRSTGDALRAIGAATASRTFRPLAQMTVPGT